ncbi:hypothetical protein IAT38_005468 [Cryptococcus sp. DSM 104549]
MSPFPESTTSTVSHWQATNRGLDALWEHGSTAPLPKTTDILIVGGGITGASLAYQLTRPGAAGEGKTIVMLEAKDLASGASGRNGGHIAPASFTVFPSLIAPLCAGGSGLSEEEALHVLDNEMDTLEYAAELVEKERLDVDFWKGQKLEVKVSEGAADSARAAYKAFKSARSKSENHPPRSGEWELIDDPVQAKAISRVSAATIVCRGPGGSNHPHKLTTALTKLALASTCSDFSFFSWAPVKSVQPRASGEGYTVDCHERGAVEAKSVVLCTNGHTRHILPGSDIEKHITPFRGHASLVTPPATFSGPNTLTTSYGIENGPYLITTPQSGIVLGPYNTGALHDGVARKKDIFEVYDDSVVMPSMHNWMKEYCARTFEGWGKEAHGEGLVRSWTGIMGASRDHLPLIGEVPGSPNLFAAVAFHGHGMARILTATRGLAHLLKTSKWDVRLPVSFKITKERLRRAREESPAVITAEELAEEGELEMGMKELKVDGGLREDVVPRR